MKIRSIILFFLIVTFAGVKSYGQTPVLTANRIYGLNPLLYNGKFYTFFTPVNTRGSQFIDGPVFVKGSVDIRGGKFNNVLLNYDIHNQQVVLKYKTQMNNMMEIVLSNVWLKSFNLGNKYFEVLTFPGVKSRIYQVIGKGHYEILYTWRKDYNLSNSYGATNFAFSKPVRDSYLKSGNKLLHFKSNKSFVDLFRPENRSVLNKYLRRNKIKLNRLKKSRLQTVERLINYCNTLPSK